MKRVNLPQETRRWAGSVCFMAALFIAACGESTATRLPSPPENLVVALAARDRISLSWAPRPDIENVVSYSVYRDRFQIGSSVTTSFIDSTAPEAANHAYSVASHSEAGVVSELSVAVSIFAPDATPPVIIAGIPANNAINVGPTQVIEFKFSEPLDPASLSSSTIDVRVFGESAPLAGTVAYNSATRTVTWTPQQALPAEKRVVVTVTTSVKDTAGNSFAAPHQRSFTIRESSAPFVVAFSPADGATTPMGVWPTVRFSERVIISIFGQSSGVRLLDFVGGVNVMIDGADYDTLTNTATLRPGGKRLKSFHPYTVEVNDNTVDLAGNRAVPFKFNIQFGEWTLPEIKEVFPAEGAVNAPRGGPVQVFYLNSPIPPVNDYLPNLEVRVTGTTQPIGSVLGYGSISVSRYVSQLLPNTQYTATFYHFFTDSKGVRQEMTKEWTFTTGD